MSTPLEDLFTAFLEGELDADGLARLDELLAADPEACRTAADWYAVHRGLGFVLQEASPAAVAAALVARIREDRERFVATVRSKLPAGGKPGRHRRVLGYALVSLAAVLLTVLAQWVFRAAAPTELPNRAEYVATLARAQNAEWSNAGLPPVGGRLLPGRYTLTSGAAVFQFDDGATVVLTAPADVRIDSRSSLTLHNGRASVRAAEVAAGFILRTPTRDVLDLGTEFEVTVAPSGQTEVHVLEGAVETLRSGVADTRLLAGEALRFDPADQTSVEKIPLNAEPFAARLKRIPPDAGRLLLSERFDYALGAHPLEQCGGGLGWGGPWRMRLRQESAETLNLPATGDLSVVAGPDGADRAVELRGTGGRARPLSEPVAMDVDAVYYLAFRVWAEPVEGKGPQNSPQIISRLSFRVSADWNSQAAAFWLNKSGRPQINSPTIGGFVARESKPVRQPCLWVAKIVASRTAPDQMFLSVFGPDERVPDTEPAEWMVKTNGFFSDARYDVLFLNTVHPGKHWYDNIRLGTSWVAVTHRPEK